MRRAIAADFAAIPGAGSRVVVTLDTRWAEDPGPWAIVPIGPGQLPERLLELARAADYTVLIAPETTGILAGLTRDLERAGARLLGSSPEAVELTGDKARLADWFGDTRDRHSAYADDRPRRRASRRIWSIPPCSSRSTGPVRSIPSISPTARAYPSLRVPCRGPCSSRTSRGIPMSASFLVDARSAAHLIGIGRQRMEIEEGKFRYVGGVLPVPCPRAEPLLRRAVASIPGLRGFVGVDFLWDPSRCEAVVLEINPRPTTSFVGLSRLLPAGWLARAWLACCGAGQPPSRRRSIWRRSSMRSNRSRSTPRVSSRKLTGAGNDRDRRTGGNPHGKLAGARHRRCEPQGGTRLGRDPAPGFRGLATAPGPGPSTGRADCGTSTV